MHPNHSTETLTFPGTLCMNQLNNQGNPLSDLNLSLIPRINSSKVQKVTITIIQRKTKIFGFNKLVKAFSLKIKDIRQEGELEVCVDYFFGKKIIKHNANHYADNNCTNIHHVHKGDKKNAAYHPVMNFFEAQLRKTL